MPDIKIANRIYRDVSFIHTNTVDGDVVIFKAKEEPLWAYLNQNTLYLSRADAFTQNDTTLEVNYIVS